VCVAVWCIALQERGEKVGVAVCCGVLQCVAVCCSVLREQRNTCITCTSAANRSDGLCVTVCVAACAEYVLQCVLQCVLRCVLQYRLTCELTCVLQCVLQCVAVCCESEGTPASSGPQLPTDPTEYPIAH